MITENVNTKNFNSERMYRDFNWMAGGPQGSGVDSSANIFARACCYGGLHVYGQREYHSNIKGLHSYFNISVSPNELKAIPSHVDLLCTFDADSIVRHIWEVSSGGGIICDSELLQKKLTEIPTLSHSFREEFQKTLDEKGIKPETVGDLLNDVKKDGVRIYTVSYLELIKQLAKELGEVKLNKLTIMTNILTVGISFGIVHYDKKYVATAVEKIFGKKEKIISMNVIAFNLAYDYATTNFKDFGFNLNAVQTDEKRIFIQGVQAVALGKLVGGCRSQSYYPITPAGDESAYLEENEVFELERLELEKQPELEQSELEQQSELKQQSELEQSELKNVGSILVTQTEDEIAAINMASGAALTGARAATSTSGPGFSLMVEGLGWAGINEVPTVISLYQRTGPSTGLPTRHGQEDLRFIIHASHGEFPRIILCSGDIEECFYDAVRVFNYAERYQTPVIHLIDKAIANSSKSCQMFDTNLIKIERGQLLSDADVNGKEYKRFRFTESGISPRVPLGTPGVVFWNTGDEHDELGHVTENPSTRIRMVDKRMKKLELADKEIPPNERVNFFGDEDAPVTIISWGSPKGAIIEAMERLHQEKYKLNFLQIRMPLPLPKEYISKVLRKATKKIDVEGNYSAQMAGIIREETGIAMDYFVLKWSGRPMTSDELYDALLLILQDKAPVRQVLTYGS